MEEPEKVAEEGDASQPESGSFLAPELISVADTEAGDGSTSDQITAQQAA
jgi:hypothetical protein